MEGMAIDLRYLALLQAIQALVEGWDGSPQGSGEGLEASFYDALEFLRSRLEEPMNQELLKSA